MITVWDWLILATTLVALYGVILRREARGLVPAQRTLLDYRSVPFSVLLFKAIWRVVTLVCCVVVAFLPIYLSLVILLFVGDPPVAVWVALCLLGPPLGLAAARYFALSALDIAGRRLRPYVCRGSPDAYGAYMRHAGDNLSRSVARH